MEEGSSFEKCPFFGELRSNWVAEHFHLKTNVYIERNYPSSEI